MFERACYVQAPAIAWVPPELTLRAYGRLLLQARFRDVGETVPRFNQIDRRELSKRFYRETKLPIGCDPFWYLERLGGDYCEVPLPSQSREVYHKGLVAVSPKGGPMTWGPLAGHGVLHHVAVTWWPNGKRWGSEMRHSDMWLSTYETFCPEEWLKDVGLEEAKRVLKFFPGWFVEDYWDAVWGQL